MRRFVSFPFREKFYADETQRRKRTLFAELFDGGKDPLPF
jgi:hypothetical protein